MARTITATKATIATCLAAALLAAAVPAGAGIIYVDAGSISVIHDGASWCTAYLDLQDALAVAEDGDVIQVAQGTYKPHASDRTVSFALTDTAADSTPR